MLGLLVEIRGQCWPCQKTRTKRGLKIKVRGGNFRIFITRNTDAGCLGQNIFCGNRRCKTLCFAANNFLFAYWRNCADQRWA